MSTFNKYKKHAPAFTNSPSIKKICDILYWFAGEGNFGKVYTAVNIDTGDLMAMKEVTTTQLYMVDINVYLWLESTHL